MLKLALSQHGASNANSTHYELPPDVESRNGRHDGFGAGGNGLEPLDAPPPRENSDRGSPGPAGEAEEEYGVHL
jgi:hypothetical protein